MTKATLPKTGEQQSSWSMLGWLGLIACGYVLGETT
ncbi:LPXTG cell wall anchor domain-containing protein [Levilactobacillus brevis]|nr:LPXTG cell wall anchor domain-containing protein [Levilactobacillus brevis]